MPYQTPVGVVVIQATMKRRSEILLAHTEMVLHSTVCELLDELTNIPLMLHASPKHHAARTPSSAPREYPGAVIRCPSFWTLVRLQQLACEDEDRTFELGTIGPAINSLCDSIFQSTEAQAAACVHRRRT